MELCFPYIKSPFNAGILVAQASPPPFSSPHCRPGFASRNPCSPGEAIRLGQFAVELPEAIPLGPASPSPQPIGEPASSEPPEEEQTTSHPLSTSGFAKSRLAPAGKELRYSMFQHSKYCFCSYIPQSCYEGIVHSTLACMNWGLHSSFPWHLA